MHVIVPRVFWDLYFDGELIATVSPEQRQRIQIRVPSGCEFDQMFNRFKLTKNGVVVRVWNLKDGQFQIMDEAELKRQFESKEKQEIFDPEIAKMIRSYSPRIKAPSIEEAKTKMKKAVETNE